MSPDDFLRFVGGADIMRTTGSKVFSIAAAALAVSGLVMVTPGVADLAGTALSRGTIVYQDTGDDPRRAHMPDAKFAYWADVLRTSRELVRRDDGKQRVRVGVTSRRDFPVPRRTFRRADGFRMIVYLDTKGGGRYDYYFLISLDVPRKYCACVVFDDGNEPVEYFRYWVADNGALKMSAPARWLDVRKHIRWNVETSLVIGGKAIEGFDIAPNVGRYS